MNKRDVLEIAIKLMGLYLLFTFLGGIFTLGIALSSAQVGQIHNKPMYISFACLEILLRLTFALVLLYKGDLIAQTFGGSAVPSPQQRTVPSPHVHLSLWVRILGLYFVLSIIPHLVWDVAEVVGVVTAPNWSTRILSEAVQLALSLICILRNESVATFIEKHTKPAPNN
ncbi:MAG: hypothetical protein ABSD58_06890 [Verrucomicrobiia bacterium]|jgi:hypothetical protein